MTKETLLMMNINVRGEGGDFPLKDFYFHIAGGELVGLTGTEDSGTRTVYELLTGRLRPSGGSITFGGEESSFLGERILEHPGGIYVIHRNAQIIHDYTVAETLFILENVNYFSIMPSRHVMEKEAQKLLERFGIPLSARRKCSSLSNTEIRFVQILRAYVKKARLLILNDILEDSIRKDMDVLLSLLRKAAEGGMSVLWINSYPDVYNRMADRTVVLRRGRNVLTMYRDSYDEKRLLKLMGLHSPAGEERTSVLPSEEDVRFELVRLENAMLPCLDLQVRKGEILGLLDPENHISRTLYYIFMGKRAYRGEIRVDGRPVRLKKDYDLIRSRIALINGKYLDRMIFPDMSRLENLKIAAEKMSAVFGIFTNRGLSQAAEDLYTRIRGHKGEDLKRMPSPVDREELVIHLLSRYLLSGAGVLLYFQPFLGMDFEEKARLARILYRLKSRHLSILLISGDPTALSGACDRIVPVRELVREKEDHPHRPT